MRHVSSIFGNLLLNERKKRGWSREKLSAEASVAASSIQAIEAGDQNPSLDTAIKLAKVLNISLDEVRREVSGETNYQKEFGI